MTYPNFFDKAPVIRLRDPLAQLLGSAAEGIMDYHYVDAVRLAGHSCPTVAGAFLTARAALQALYPDTLPERGAICVRMPSAETDGTTGVVAQVLTLITGAHDGAVRFERLDTGAAVMVKFDAHKIPADESQRERMQAVIQNRETPEQQAEFARLWQERVRRILLEHADDPALLSIVHLS